MRSAICGKEAEEPTLQTRHQPEKYLFRYASWSGASGTLCQNGSSLSSRGTIPSRAGCLGITTSSTCEPMSRSWERTLSNWVVIWACLNRGRRSNHKRKSDAPTITVLPRSLCAPKADLARLRLNLLRLLRCFRRFGQRHRSDTILKASPQRHRCSGFPLGPLKSGHAEGWAVPPDVHSNVVFAKDLKDRAILAYKAVSS